MVLAKLRLVFLVAVDSKIQQLNLVLLELINDPFDFRIIALHNHFQGIFLGLCGNASQQTKEEEKHLGR